MAGSLLVSAALLVFSAGIATAASSVVSHHSEQTAASIGPVPSADQSRPDAWLKGALHVHSASHGDDLTSADSMVDRYQELDFDFVVFTDHNRATEFERAPTTTPGDESLVATYIGVELSHDSDFCGDGRESVCTVHVNSIFIPATAANRFSWSHLDSGSQQDLGRYLVETARAMGGLAVVNHPTTDAAVDGALLYSLWEAGADFVDIDEPGDVVLWDAALTAGARMYGISTDDAHSPAAAGSSWVMVRAENTQESIRQGLSSGSFYSTSGVILSRLDVDPGFFVVEIAGEAEGLIEFIGQRGQVLKRVEGAAAHFDLGLLPRGGYVRAVVTAGDGTQAWTQPIWRPERAAGHS